MIISSLVNLGFKYFALYFKLFVDYKDNCAFYFRREFANVLQREEG